MNIYSSIYLFIFSLLFRDYETATVFDVILREDVVLCSPSPSPKRQLRMYSVSPAGISKLTILGYYCGTDDLRGQIYVT